MVNGSERPARCAYGVADRAVLSLDIARRANGMFRFVMRLRQIGCADVVSCFVAEPQKGDQQQQSDGPRRAPQPSQGHTVFQISILPGCFR